MNDGKLLANAWHRLLSRVSQHGNKLTFRSVVEFERRYDGGLRVDYVVMKILVPHDEWDSPLRKVEIDAVALNIDGDEHTGPVSQIATHSTACGAEEAHWHWRRTAKGELGVQRGRGERAEGGGGSDANARLWAAGCGSECEKTSRAGRYLQSTVSTTRMPHTLNSRSLLTHRSTVAFEKQKFCRLYSAPRETCDSQGP